MNQTRRRESLRATAIIPLLYEARVIACLNVASHTLDEVPDFARSALETIAAQVGNVIVRQRAGEALQQYAERLQILHEINQSDIDMPRMDGFELTQRVKQDQRYHELPVILVTSLESPEHKARGIEVGADAYIIKSSFDQDNLLETIRQLI